MGQTTVAYDKMNGESTALLQGLCRRTGSNGVTLTQPATQPGLIRKTPGVCGGSACVRDTRVPVWTLWRLKEIGRTDAQLLEDYPTLTPHDLAAAWAYVRQNPDEIRRDIDRQGRSPARNT